VGFHGTVETDSETGEMLHFDSLADRIPVALELTSASTAVDFDVVDVGGTPCLLPVRSETRSNIGRCIGHDRHPAAEQKTLSRHGCAHGPGAGEAALPRPLNAPCWYHKSLSTLFQICKARKGVVGPFLAILGCHKT
jgi:hypothetical protein